MKDFLQYIWEHQLFSNARLVTSSNIPFKIVNRGNKNKHVVGKFTNAIVEIDNIKWVGTVAVLEKSSHGYIQEQGVNNRLDNVVLLVVKENDDKIYRKEGNEIPCFVITYSAFIEENYFNCNPNKTAILCNKHLHKVDPFSKKLWLTRLLIERLALRYNEIQVRLKVNNNDYEETLYQMLARGLGASVNGEVYEQLSHKLPLKILLKYRNNLMQLESLLFGVGGFLNSEPLDEYTKALQKEYQFLKHKHQLNEMCVDMWQHYQLRPSNFPTLRISQFAQLIYSTANLFSKTIKEKNLEYIKKALMCKASSYWNTHYVFGKMSIYREKHLGKSAIDSILINVIIPYIFAYGKDHDDRDVNEYTVELLEKIRAEKNTIMNDWADVGWFVENAFESQALIQLRKKYCNNFECMRCSIGHCIATSEEQETQAKE